MKDFCPFFSRSRSTWRLECQVVERKKEEIQANYHCWVNTEDGYVYLLPRKEQM